MPFGKYKDTKIIDLPVSYLEWFQRKGFPDGKLGMLLSTMYEIRLNDLMFLIYGLQKRMRWYRKSEIFLHLRHKNKRPSHNRILPNKILLFFTSSPKSPSPFWRRGLLALLQEGEGLGWGVLQNIIRPIFFLRQPLYSLQNLFFLRHKHHFNEVAIIKILICSSFCTWYGNSIQ